MRAARALAVAFAVWSAACTQDNALRLVLGESALDSGEMAPDGFACLHQINALQGVLLARRLTEMDNPQLSFVVDIQPLGGFADCRFAELGAWCQAPGHDCRPLRSARQCFAAQLPAGRIGDGQALRVVTDAIHQLAGTPVTEDAPDGVVIVRLVGTTESCAEVEATPSLDRDRLIGCVHSCPAILDETEGDLLLSLEGSGRYCEGSVMICASDDFDPEATAGTDIGPTD